MDKEVVVHIYNGVLTVKQNKFESVPVRWMNLESVVWSEVSQKEKNKYCILPYICGIWKKGTDETICKAEINTQM